MSCPIDMLVKNLPASFKTYQREHPDLSTMDAIKKYRDVLISRQQNLEQAVKRTHGTKVLDKLKSRITEDREKYTVKLPSATEDTSQEESSKILDALRQSATDQYRDYTKDPAAFAAMKDLEEQVGHIRKLGEKVIQRLETVDPGIKRSPAEQTAAINAAEAVRKALTNLDENIAGLDRDTNNKEEKKMYMVRNSMWDINKAITDHLVGKFHVQIKHENGIGRETLPVGEAIQKIADPKIQQYLFSAASVIPRNGEQHAIAELVRKHVDKYRENTTGVTAAEASSNVYAQRSEMLSDLLDHIQEFPQDSINLFGLTGITARQLKSDFSGNSSRVGDKLKNIPGYNLLSMFTSKRGKAPSLLATVPHLPDMLNDPAIVRKLLGSKVLTPKEAASLQQLKKLHTVVGESIHNNMLSKEGIGKESLEGVYDILSKSPAVYLMRKNGQMPDNVIMAVALGIQEWVGMQGWDTMQTSKKHVAQILGIDEDKVTKEMMKRYAKVGTLRSNVVNFLADSISKNLHLSPLEMADGYLNERFKQSLGLMAYSAMTDMGLLEKPKEMSSATFYKDMKNAKQAATTPYEDMYDEYYQAEKENSKKGPKTIFVKIKNLPNPDKKVKGRIPSKRVQQLMDGFNDSRSLSQKLFAIKDFNPSYSTKPIKHVKLSINRTSSEISNDAENVLELAQTRAYTPVEPTKGLIQALVGVDGGLEFKKGVLDWKDPDLQHVTMRDSQEGKNLDIHNQLESLLDLYNSGNKELYLAYDTKRNMRAMITSRDINVVASKLHRFTLAHPEWKTEISVNDATHDNEDFKWFIRAVGQGLGKELDKNLNQMMDQINGDPGKISQAFHDFVINTLEKEGPINDAIKALKRHHLGKPLTSQERADIYAGIGEAGEKGHSLAALSAYAEYQLAAETEGMDTFSHSLPFEIDGMQNGLAISFLQLPASTAEERVGKKVENGKTVEVENLTFLKELLKGVGMYTSDMQRDGKQIDSFAAARIKGLIDNDNYQSLASKTDQKLDEITSEVFLEELLAEGNRNPGDMPIKYKYEKAKKLDGIRKLPFLREFMPKIRDESGEVTSEGRNLAKDPLMQANYGAGGMAISRIPSSMVEENIYTKMIDAVDNAEDSQAALAELFAIVNKALEAGMFITEQELAKLYKDDRLNVKTLKLPPFMRTQKEHMKPFASIKDFTAEIAKMFPEAKKDLPEDRLALYRKFAREFTLTFPTMLRVKARVEETYGKALWDGIQEFLGPQINVRAQLMQGLQLLNYGYQMAYQQRKQEWMDAHPGNVPSERVEKQIVEELRDEGWSSAYPHPGTNRKSSGPSVDYLHFLEVINTSKELVEDVDDRLAVAEFRTKNGTVSQQLQRYQPNGTVGMAGYTRGIVSIEARIMQQAMESAPVDSIYDGVMIGSKDIGKVSETVDRAMYETNKDYSMAGELQSRLAWLDSSTKFFSAMEQRFNSDPSYAAAVYKGIFREDMEEEIRFSAVLADVQSTMNALVQMVESNRDILFNTPDGLAAVNQYSLMEHPHSPKHDGQPTNTKTFGSSDVLPDTNTPFKERFERNLLAGNIQEIYEELSNYETVDISPEHEKQLQKIMDKVIVPGMDYVDNARQTLSITERGQVNAGFVRGDEVYLEAAGNTLTSPSAMSLRETSVHEYVHLVLKNFIDTGDFWGRNELEKLFEMAKDRLTWRDFLPMENGEIKGDPDIAEAKARQRYDHVFNNANGDQLHEFASMGLTHEPMANALANLGVRKSKKSVWSSNPLTLLWNILMRALEFISTRAYKTSKGNVYSALENIAVQAASQNQKNKANLAYQIEKKAAKMWNAAGVSQMVDKVKYRVLDKAVSITTGKKTTPIRNWDTNTEERGYSLGALKEAVDMTARGLKNGFEAAFNKDMTGIQEVVQEFTGLRKRDQRKARTIKRMANKLVDQPRKGMEVAAKQIVEQGFDPKKPPTKNEYRALNDVFMKGDLGVLLDQFSATQIQEMLEDSTVLNDAINGLRESLESTFGRNGIAYRNQAASLGMITATGQIPSNIGNPMWNAHNIAHLRFLNARDRKPVGDLNKAEALIDKLASLHHLQYTHPDVKARAARVFSREMSRGPDNGIVNLLAMHQAFKERSLDVLFDGNKISTRKGYIPDKFDDAASVRTEEVTPEKQKEMKRKGYELIQVLQRDPTDQTRQKSGLYASKLGLDRYRTSILALTNPQHAGTTVFESLHDNGYFGASPNIGKNLARAKIANRKKALRAFESNLDVRETGHPVLLPILSPKTGTVLEYRYIMSDENKVNLLGQDNQAHESMGRMFASIPNKLGTKELNGMLLKQLKADWDELRSPKRLDKSEKKAPWLDSEKNIAKHFGPKYKWDVLSPMAADKESRALWRMLPEDMKREARKVFGKEMLPVRKDMRNYYMGHREKSIAGTLIKANKKYDLGISVNMLTNIRVMDDVIKEIVGLARAKVSILLPEVVMDNFLSNTLLLLGDGIGPTYILNKTREGIAAMRKHQKQQEELDRLSLQIGTGEQQGKNMSKEKARQAYLTKEMELNPVNQLIKEGLFQTIVQDVDPSQFGTGSRRPLSTFIENSLDKINSTGIDMVSGATRELFMSPGSHSFASAVSLNQYGDFVARYVKYSHDTQVLKKDKTDAINESLDAFIFYDEPSNATKQAAEDYGFLMFTKFLFRIQRVLFKMWGEKTAGMLMVWLLQQATTDVGDISEYFVAGDKMIANSELIPLKRVEDAMGMPLFKWLGYPFGMWQEGIGETIKSAL